MSTGPTGVVVSGQIVQPGLGDTPFPSGRFGGCFANSNNAIANYTLTVGGVGSKIPTADAGIAAEIAGDVSSSFLSLGPISPIPFFPMRKRIGIQKEGRTTGVTSTFTIASVGKTVRVDNCTDVLETICPPDTIF